MTTLDIQRRLAARGYDPGPLDGIAGRLTSAALRRFQAGRGLEAHGRADRRTLSALFGHEVAAEPLPWFAEAERLMGLREVRGPAHAPAILSWARRLKLAYGADETPWCGLFVAHCVAATLAEEPLPANPLAARAWTRFGRTATPRPGAVLVFWRGRRDGWQGHVGFHAGADETAFHVLGGNQGNRVSVVRIARSRLIACRWPATVPEPAVAAALPSPAPSPSLSTDEA